MATEMAVVMVVIIRIEIDRGRGRDGKINIFSILNLQFSNNFQYFNLKNSPRWRVFCR